MNSDRLVQELAQRRRDDEHPLLISAGFLDQLGQDRLERLSPVAEIVHQRRRLLAIVRAELDTWALLFCDEHDALSLGQISLLQYFIRDTRKILQLACILNSIRQIRRNISFNDWSNLSVGDASRPVSGYAIAGRQAGD